MIIDMDIVESPDNQESSNDDCIFSDSRKSARRVGKRRIYCEFYHQYEFDGKTTVYVKGGQETVYENTKIGIWNNNLSADFKFIIITSDYDKVRQIIPSVYISDRDTEKEFILKYNCITLKILSKLPPYENDQTFKFEFATDKDALKFHQFLLNTSPGSITTNSKNDKICWTTEPD